MCTCTLMSILLLFDLCTSVSSLHGNGRQSIILDCYFWKKWADLTCRLLINRSVIALVDCGTCRNDNVHYLPDVAESLGLSPSRTH